jgi:ABC-type transport system involved in Fe-S cluster assembly fused permease/ATPase subunit
VEVPTDEKKAEGKSEKDQHASIFETSIILKPYFWPNRGTDGAWVNRTRSFLTWFFVGCSKACSLIAPQFLSSATNDLVAGKYGEATISIILYNAFRFGSSLFKEMQSMIYLKVKQQANIQLAEQSFTHIHSLSLNWHLSKKMGNVIRSMDRGTVAADTLITYLFLFLVPTILECIAVVLLFLFEFNQWRIGVCAMSGVFLYATMTIYITNWRKKFRAATNKHDNDFHDKASDSIINYETVKYFGGESFEIDRYVSSVAQFQKFDVKMKWSMGGLNVMQQFVIALTMTACLLIAGKEVTSDDMSIGDFVAVNAYVVSMFAPLSFLGSIYNAIIKSLTDVKHFLDLMAEEPDIVDEEHALPIPLPGVSYDGDKSSTQRSAEMCSGCQRVAVFSDWLYCPNCGSSNKNVRHLRTAETVSGKDIEEGGGGGDVQLVSQLKDDQIELHQHGVDIEFKNVSFHYPTQLAEKGLQHVSFHVPAGTTTAIVGHSGSGKTTVSRLLYRFYDPLGGQVNIGGYNVKNYTQNSVRNAIGIVPQDCVLFNDSIFYNIQYGRHGATREEVLRAAEAAQIKQFVEELPDGWDTIVGERGLKLSGGEKQRVAIARCLLKDPPIVVLDEATSALDSITEESVQEALYTLGKNRTVLVIAHRLSTIKNADQILVMGEGAVLEQGTHSELLSQSDGVYAQLWERQFQQDHSEEEGEKEKVEIVSENSKP